jgi:hypothetical protein
MLQQGSDFHFKAIPLYKNSLSRPGVSLEVMNLHVSSSPFIPLSATIHSAAITFNMATFCTFLLLSTIHLLRNASNTNMTVTTEVVVDEDVSGDCYHDGLTYVFDDIDPIRSLTASARIYRICV